MWTEHRVNLFSIRWAVITPLVISIMCKVRFPLSAGSKETLHPWRALWQCSSMTVEGTLNPNLVCTTKVGQTDTSDLSHQSCTHRTEPSVDPSKLKVMTEVTDAVLEEDDPEPSCLSIAYHSQDVGQIWILCERDISITSFEIAVFTNCTFCWISGEENSEN